MAVFPFGHKSWTQARSVHAYLLLCQTATRFPLMSSPPFFKLARTTTPEDLLADKRPSRDYALCAERVERSAKRSIANNKNGDGNLTCMLVGVVLRSLPIRQIPLIHDLFHVSHLSFGSLATRGDSVRACGFVSHAFAWFTLVETEPTSTFSSFAS